MSDPRLQRVTGFPPVSSRNARVLVLGSMPGEESLRRRSYYGHPRNLFWPMMAELFGFVAELGYEQRLRALVANRVALWDVVRRCRRQRSADQSIRDVAPNDFPAFFADHGGLAAIFFNGQKAEALFARLVAPQLEPRLRGLHFERLPSTSPAYAALPRQAKLDRWRAVAAWAGVAVTRRSPPRPGSPARPRSAPPRRGRSDRPGSGSRSC